MITQQQIKEAKEYTLKRVQAQHNSRSKVDKVLLTAALQLARGISEDKVSKSISNQISDITYGYAEASLSFRKYDDGEKDLKEYMEGVHYGKTFDNRNDEYCKRFVADMIITISACRELSYSESEIKSVIHSSFKDPLKSPVIQKAIKEEQFTFNKPTYGIGRTNVSYTAITNNSENTIASAFGLVNNNFYDANGAKGFYVYRGSSYPCAECQSHVGRFHKMGEDYPPFHNHCVCYVVYL